MLINLYNLTCLHLQKIGFIKDSKLVLLGTGCEKETPKPMLHIIRNSVQGHVAAKKPIFVK